MNTLHKKDIASKNDIGFEDQETEHNVLLSDTSMKTLTDFGITFQGQYLMQCRRN